MEWLRKYLIDGIFVTLVLGLLVAAVVPWPISDPVLRKDQSSPVPQAGLPRSGVSVKRSDPAAIAGVFGFRAAPVSPSVAPSPGPRQETASWLSFLGYVAGENGKKWKYYFKDTRANEVIMLTPGEENAGGWKLVAVTEKSFIVRNKGTTYTVPK